MKLFRLTLVALLAIITTLSGIVSLNYAQASTSSPAATGSYIVNDQFTIPGTRGTNFCDMINSTRIGADQRGINAGRIHVSFTANASVNFWILTTSQYNAWVHNFTTCSTRLEAPSILTVASRSNYESATLQIPKTDNYYFVFDNRNPNAVSVSFEADYPSDLTSTSNLGSGPILNARFNINGISGRNSRCIFNDNYHALVEAGHLNVYYTSTGGVVDFWILNSHQHSEWTKATTCASLEKSPSLFSAIATYGYNGDVQFNSTDTYYFAFANFNQGNVSITLTVSYVTQKIEKQTGTDLRSLLSNPAQIGNYWPQLLGAVATGGSVILGWMFKTRKRRFLTSYMAKIDSTFNQYAINRDDCEKRLEKMRNEIVRMLKSGRIDESHFTILEDKITQYLKELE